MVLLRATLLLFQMHLASVLRSRRALLCGLLAVIPPLLAWLVVNYGPEIPADRTGGFLQWMLVLQVIVPIVALVGGSAVLTEELESRTITYPFTRPIPRAALLYGRWLATLVLVSGSLGASAWLTGRAVLGGRPPTNEPLDERLQGREGEWYEKRRALDELRVELESQHPPAEREELLRGVLRRSVAAAALGGAVYSLLFAVIGVFLRHPMIVGLGYAFAMEGLLANVPGESQSLSIQYYLRSIVLEERLWVFHRLYQWELTGFAEPLESVRVIGVVMLVALVIGGWAIGRRQYVLTA